MFKLKSKLILAVMVIFGVTAFMSCEKEEYQIQNNSKSTLNSNKQLNIDDKSNTPYIYEGVEYYYYLDNKLMSIKDFKPHENTNSFICISGERETENDSNFTKIIIHEFSTKNGYIKFGEKNKLKLKELLLFENDIHNYIEKNGIEKIFNQTNIIPKKYLEYEKSRYNYYFKNSNKFFPGTTLHKNYWGGSPAHHMTSTMPVMFGWNNTVSSTFPTYPYGAHTLYNRSWFRSRLATLSGFGWVYYRFVGPLSYLNDKMSSGVTT